MANANPVFYQPSSANGSVVISNTGIGGTAVTDSGGGGISIDATGGSSVLSLNPSGHAVGIGTSTASLTTDTGLTGGLRIAATTTNADANLGLLPNGASNTSNIEWRNSSDTSNVGVFNIKLIGATAYLESLAIGTGTLPTTIDTSSMNLLIQSTTPATSSSTGTAGWIAYDSNYVYVCVATNTWKRAAISTW